jgi:hypothetical protein
MKLTGFTRYRVQWLTGKMVLQVEVSCLVAENVGGHYIDCEQRTWWRDATVQDVTAT